MVADDEFSETSATFCPLLRSEISPLVVRHKIAYFDRFSGISGDMVLGTLVDAGCDLAQVEAQLRKLPVHGFEISVEKVIRKGLAATHMKVESSQHHPHRPLFDIL